MFYSVSSILSTIPLCLLNILAAVFNTLIFFRELIVLFIFLFTHETSTIRQNSIIIVIIIITIIKLEGLFI